MVTDETALWSPASSGSSVVLFLIINLNRFSLKTLQAAKLVQYRKLCKNRKHLQEKNKILYKIAHFELAIVAMFTTLNLFNNAD